jgi:uncharacterized protein (DUF849 family)
MLVELAGAGVAHLAVRPREGDPPTL